MVHLPLPVCGRGTWVSRPQRRLPRVPMGSAVAAVWGLPPRQPALRSGVGRFPILVGVGEVDVGEGSGREADSAVDRPLALGIVDLPAARDREGQLARV